MTVLAQGWPANYDGVMLQGFYWDSYADTKWTNLESQADEVEIDLEQVAEAVCGQAKADGVGEFSPADVFFVVQADLDFQEQNL